MQMGPDHFHIRMIEPANDQAVSVRSPYDGVYYNERFNSVSSAVPNGQKPTRFIHHEARKFLLKLYIFQKYIHRGW